MRQPDQAVCPACNANRPHQGWPVDPYIGRLIDQKYRIEKRLAAGGFGTVFLATHLHGEHELGKVVLKFLHSELAHDAAIAKRFVTEAKAARELTSPHVVRVFDLGFSEEDRRENIRRVGHVARLFADAGCLAITAFISPHRAERDAVRGLLPAGRFFEVHVATPLEECERRDPKGLYKKARAGEIADFTGLSSPYEAPEAPQLRLDTTRLSIEAAADAVIATLRLRGVIAN